jgi:dihydroorotate dehydrogenase (fumarate)
MQLKDPLPDSIKGNMGGLPTKAISEQMIEKTRRTYGDRFVIIGVGGIFNADDAYRKIQLGADMVELITGMIFEGPQLIGQINHGLAERLKRDGFKHIAEAVGSAL